MIKSRRMRWSGHVAEREEEEEEEEEDEGEWI
jgi:hypothetical protein